MSADAGEVMRPKATRQPTINFFIENLLQLENRSRWRKQSTRSSSSMIRHDLFQRWENCGTMLQCAVIYLNMSAVLTYGLLTQVCICAHSRSTDVCRQNLKMKANPTQDERASAVKPNSDDVALHNGK